MRYRKLDGCGDYILGRRNEMYEGTEAVAQAVKTRLLLLLGEWWESPSDGTPLFEKVLGQRLKASDSPDEIDLVFSERINGTQGVSDISAFESKINPETREYKASITIKTIYGTEFKIILSSGNSPLDIKL